MDFDLIKLYTTLGLGGFGIVIISGITIYLVKYMIKTQERLIDALESNSIALTSICDSLETLNTTIQADNREARIKRNMIDNRLVRIDTKMINMGSRRE
jgi:hypothetical protein